MAATINGTPVNFSFLSPTGITLAGGTDDGLVVAGLVGVLLQSASYKKNSNRTLVKGGDGDRVSSIHNDRFNSATLKWKVSGATLAAAITNTKMSQPGNFIVITACDSLPDIVHATNRWEVISGEVSGSNEDVKEISLEIEYAAGIQARAA